MPPPLLIFFSVGFSRTFSCLSRLLPSFITKSDLCRDASSKRPINPIDRALQEMLRWKASQASHPPQPLLLTIVTLTGTANQVNERSHLYCQLRRCIQCQYLWFTCHGLEFTVVYSVTIYGLHVMV